MDENPYRAPKTPAPGGARHTFWFLIAFYVLAAFAGIRGTIRVAYDAQSSGLDILLPIADAVCLGCWTLADAKRRGHHIPSNTRLWFFLLAGIVVPGYVIWSRGWRGLGWVALNCIGWFAVATLASIVCAALLNAGLLGG